MVKVWWDALSGTQVSAVCSCDILTNIFSLASFSCEWPRVSDKAFSVRTGVAHLLEKRITHSRACVYQRFLHDWALECFAAAHVEICNWDGLLSAMPLEYAHWKTSKSHASHARKLTALKGRFCSNIYFFTLSTVSSNPATAISRRYFFLITCFHIILYCKREDIVIVKEVLRYIKGSYLKIAHDVLTHHFF